MRVAPSRTLRRCMPGRSSTASISRAPTSSSDGPRMNGPSRAHRLAKRSRRSLERRTRATPAAAVVWWRRLAAMDPLNTRATLGLMTRTRFPGRYRRIAQGRRSSSDVARQRLGAPRDASVDRLMKAIQSGELSPPVVVLAPRAEAAVAAEPCRPAAIAASVLHHIRRQTGSARRRAVVRGRGTLATVVLLLTYSAGVAATRLPSEPPRRPPAPCRLHRRIAVREPEPGGC